MPSEEQKYQRSFDDKNTLDDLILLENPTNESITKHLENRFDKNWIYVSIFEDTLFLHFVDVHWKYDRLCKSLYRVNC